MQHFITERAGNYFQIWFFLIYFAKRKGIDAYKNIIARKFTTLEQTISFCMWYTVDIRILYCIRWVGCCFYFFCLFSPLFLFYFDETDNRGQQMSHMLNSNHNMSQLYIRREIFCTCCFRKWKTFILLINDSNKLNESVKWGL